METWRRYQKKNRVETWVSKARLVVVICLILLSIVGLFELGIWFNRIPSSSPMLSGFKDLEGWSSKNQLNLFIGPGWVAGFDRSERTVKNFQFGKDIEISQLNLITKTSKVYLDGYIITNSELEKIEDLHNFLLKGIFSTNNLNTNLKRIDLFKLWWFLRNGDYAKSSQQDVSVPEERIIDENLKVEVLNSTAIPGLAQDQAAWINNLGAEVIELGNVDGDFMQTRIEVFLDQGDYRTVERLEQIFETKATWQAPTQPRRENIRVILGKNVLQ
jgi:hypothetical protein